MHKMPWKIKTEKSDRNEPSEHEKIKLIKTRAETSATAFIKSAKSTFEIWEDFKSLATSFITHVNTISNDLPAVKNLKDKYELEKKYLNFKKIESKLDTTIFDPLIELLSDARGPKLIYNEISNLEERLELWRKEQISIFETTTSLESSYDELEIKLNEYREAMFDLKILILNQIDESSKLTEKTGELKQTLNFIRNELNNPRPSWLENINQYINKKSEKELSELKKIEGLDLILAFHALIANAEIYQEKIDPIKAIINFDQPTTNRNWKSFDPITENYILTSLIEISHLDKYLKKKKNDLSVPLPSPPAQIANLDPKDDLNKSFTAPNEEQLLREREKFQKIQVKKIKYKYSKHKHHDVETKTVLPKLPLNRETLLEEINISKPSLSGESSVEYSTPRSLPSDSPPFQSSPAIPIVKKPIRHENSSSSSSSDSSSESPSSHSGSAHSPGQAISSANQAIASGFFSRANTASEEKSKTHTISSSGSSKNSSPKKYLTTEGLFRKNSKKHPKNEDENQNDIKLRTLPHDNKPRQEI